MTREPDLTDRPDMADTETLQSALQSVLLHVQQMDMATLDATLSFRLANLARACTALQAQLRAHGAPAISPENLLDLAVFAHLMDLAGPETSRDLLDRLVEDLQSVQHLLITARSAPVWEVFRMQSHILIGLAGAVGAQGLQAMAQDLNNLANERTPGPVGPLLVRLLPVLDDLIHFVQAQRIVAVAAQ